MCCSTSSISLTSPPSTTINDISAELTVGGEQTVDRQYFADILQPVVPQDSTSFLKQGILEAPPMAQPIPPARPLIPHDHVSHPPLVRSLPKISELLPHTLQPAPSVGPPTRDPFRLSESLAFLHYYQTCFCYLHILPYQQQTLWTDLPPQFPHRVLPPPIRTVPPGAAEY